ncbi:hypothetical protein Ocin01_12293 [Orchesella cincta]|uniref:Uncharacterized protein n=1 Tax=Orchesella cincta TaxID=48709 RepID=A0A1D2MMX9_ORCCI|nr:hypothetical protein Ocin01_12293 [Orchesella cincta]
MPSTFGSSKQLRRVSGEVQLAAIKYDPQRPPTSGVPLRRCSNRARINLSQDSVSTFASTTIEERGTSSNNNAGSNIVVSNGIQYEGDGEGNLTSNTPTNFQPNEKLAIPKNAAHPAPKTESFADGIKASLEESRLKHMPYYNNKHETPRTRDAFTGDNCSSIGPTLSKFQSLTETGESRSPQNIEEHVPNPEPEVAIATATSLGLQDSNRALSSSRPSNWSLKNQGVTPKSQIASSTSFKSDGTAKQLASSLARLITGNTGDGDSASISGNGNSDSRKCADSRVPSAPPPSAATCISDRPPFKLTFRKPKLRPRSIITNVSGSGRASLPTTASTPNPIVVSQTPREEPMNNIDDMDNNNNTNIEQEGTEAPLQIVEVNNNIVESATVKPNETAKPKRSKEKISSAVFAIKKDALKEPEFQVMPAEAEVQPQPIKPDGFYEVEKVEQSDGGGGVGEDQAFWNSESTPPTPENEKAARSKSGGRSTAVSKYPTGSGYGYDSSKYPVSGYGSQQNASGYESGVPFLTTEKGAIRFHLPGRIQHKTTIKVAHFPTGDEKNVVVNLKPDKEEDDCCAPPNCANNQNFIVQPPPPPAYPPPEAYGCYPYGYGYPNYYGYGGYPPYY